MSDRVLRINYDKGTLGLADRVCRFCVMDGSDPEIEFDGAGVCNHCATWIHQHDKIMRPYAEFEEIAEQIKASRPGYNCVLGISGGLDSSYTAYVAHQAGLKALLIHLDNGFDTDEAQHNIESIREATGWEMITLYTDGPEYRDIQLAYLKAGIANIEAVTDHAISALIYRTAIEQDIKYVLSGGNWATEGILPRAWGSDNRDLKNIKAIHSTHGTIPMDRFLGMELFQRMIVEKFTLKIVKPLNYVQYDTEQALITLKTEWGFKPYGDKHGENRLTRFYQKQILPMRWGIDKRRAHLSALICNGEIPRREALSILETPPEEYFRYVGDLNEFLDRFGLTLSEFRGYMDAPKHSAKEYPNDAQVIDKLRRVRDIFKRVKWSL